MKRFLNVRGRLVPLLVALFCSLSTYASGGNSSIHLSKGSDRSSSEWIEVDTLFFDAPMDVWYHDPVKYVDYDVLFIGSKEIKGEIGLFVPDDINDFYYNCNEESPSDPNTYRSKTNTICSGILKFPARVTSIHVTKGHNFINCGIPYVDTLFYAPSMDEWFRDPVVGIEYGALFIGSKEIKGEIGLTIPDDAAPLQVNCNDVSSSTYVTPDRRTECEGVLKFPAKITSIHISKGHNFMHCGISYVDTLFYDAPMSQWYTDPAKYLDFGALFIDSKEVKGQISLTIPDSMVWIGYDCEEGRHGPCMTYTTCGSLFSSFPAEITSVHVTKGHDFWSSGLYHIDTLFFDASMDEWLADCVKNIDYDVLFIDSKEVTETMSVTLPSSLLRVDHSREAAEGCQSFSSENSLNMLPTKNLSVHVSHGYDFVKTKDIDTLYFDAPFDEWLLHPMICYDAKVLVIDSVEIKGEMSVTIPNEMKEFIHFNSWKESYLESRHYFMMIGYPKDTILSPFYKFPAKITSIHLSHSMDFESSYLNHVDTLYYDAPLSQWLRDTVSNLSYDVLVLDGVVVNGTFPDNVSSIRTKHGADFGDFDFFKVDTIFYDAPLSQWIADPVKNLQYDVLYIDSKEMNEPLSNVTIPADVDSVAKNCHSVHVGLGISYMSCDGLLNYPVPVTSLHVSKGYDFNNSGLSHVDTLYFDAPMDEWLKNMVKRLGYNVLYIDSKEVKDSMSVTVPADVESLDQVLEGEMLSAFPVTVNVFDNFPAKITSLHVSHGYDLLHAPHVDTLFYDASFAEWIQSPVFHYEADVLIIDSQVMDKEMSVTIPDDMDSFTPSIFFSYYDRYYGYSVSLSDVEGPFATLPKITSVHVSRGVDFSYSGLASSDSVYGEPTGLQIVDTLYYDAPLAQWMTDSVTNLLYHVLVVDGMTDNNGKLVIPNAVAKVDGEDIKSVFPDVNTVVLPSQVAWSGAIQLDTLFFEGSIAQWDANPLTDIEAAHVFVNGRDLNDYKIVEVLVKGNSDTVNYDGKEHSLSGFTFSCEDMAYVSSDFMLMVGDTVSATEPGEYVQPVSSDDFRNLNDDMRVRFVYTPGVLTILPPHYDFSAVCESGQTLYYQIVSGHNVRLVCPRQNGVDSENYATGELIIPDVVTNDGKRYKVTEIAEDLLRGNKEVTSVVIPQYMDVIEPNAFDGCPNLREVTCSSVFPPEAEKNTFSDYSGTLFVPCESYDDYVAHDCWGSFNRIDCIDSQSEDSSKIEVTPDYTEVVISWPSIGVAFTYTLKITTDGGLVCSLRFDQVGALISIDFHCSIAPFLSPKAAPKPAIGDAVVSAAPRLVPSQGFSFTVTGLEEGTSYHYELEALDENQEVVKAYTGDFETKSSPLLTGVDSEASGTADLYVSENRIICENAHRLPIMIYNALSQCLYACDAPCDFEVPALGVYMVKVGDKVVKVVVR